MLAANLVVPQVLTMGDALRIFRERGFDLLLAQQQVAAAQADVASASAIANPLLSAGAGKSFDYDPSCTGCSALPISLGLSDQGSIFDFLSGKRGLRKDVARAALEAARNARADAQRTLEFQLKQQFLQASLAAEQGRFAVQTLEASGRTRELMERRFKAGAISEADLARTQVAELEAMQQLDQSHQAAAQARAAVAFLLGAAEPQPAFELQPGALEDRAGMPMGTFDDLLQAAFQTRPDLRAADQQVDRASSAVSLARRQIFPDVQLSATYTQEGTGNNALTPPTLTFGLSVPLPLFYQQQGEIGRAEADLRSQQIQRDKVRAQIVQDVTQAHAALEAGQKLVGRMQEHMLERARRARDVVQIQYEKGASSLLELLDAQRTYIGVHTEYLQDLAIYWTAVAQLEEAVGKDLRP
jgi:cobalt-zinc-cadmium efflux system outer membrane protein